VTTASLAVLGHALRVQKRNEEAFDVLSRAASYKPDDAGIQTLLGITLAEKGMRGQAESAFRKALQINPNQVDAHQNLAIIYLTQQQPPIKLARWHYRKALAAGAPVSPELESRLAAATQTATPK
jgi:Flp pilus assembly protein TadD